MTLRELIMATVGNVTFCAAEGIAVDFDRLDYRVTGRQVSPEDATHHYEHVLGEPWYSDDERVIYIDFEDDDIMKDVAQASLSGR